MLAAAGVKLHPSGSDDNVGGSAVERLAIVFNRAIVVSDADVAVEVVAGFALKPFVAAGSGDSHAEIKPENQPGVQRY